MRRIHARRQPERALNPGVPWRDYLELVQAGLAARAFSPEASFVGYVRDVAERHGVVAGAITARALLVSQVQFVWRNNRLSSTPGRLWSDASLAILERPGPVTRTELLFQAEQDVSLAGNWYAVRRGNELDRLRPDGVRVVLGSDSGPVDGWVPSDARIVGYAYGDPSRPAREAFLADEVVHWKPEPHPLEWWRGQSWVTAVLSEIRNDQQAAEHTSKFFANAATPNLIFTMDPSLSPEQVQEIADAVNARHSGVSNAYRNLYVGGGASVEVVGSENAALNLRDLVGGYESRVAVRSRVPAVVLGIREGLGGSALNAGNYGQTRRLWADGWFTPTVQSLCAALERGVFARTRPVDSDLWHDGSAVLFLQEDERDAAEITQTNASAIRSLVEAGYDPASAVEAVLHRDLSRLRHSGLYSVQLQPAGAPVKESA